MSGYLRSLAERALGLAAGVRPARGPPSFAGAPSQIRAIAPPAENPETPSAPMPPESFDAAERQVDSAPSDVARAAQASEPDAKPTTPRHARLAPLADGFHDDIPTRAASHGVDPPRERRPAPSAQPDAAVPGRVARELPSEHADRSVAGHRARSFQHEERAPAEDAPPPEFSGRIRPAPQAAAAPRMTTRLARDRLMDLAQSRSKAPSPVPDVHIHIGRVELTAVAPAAPSRRESAANKKPMSLEEYLRRHSGRPS